MESIIYFIVCFLLFTHPFIYFGNKKTIDRFKFNKVLMDNLSIITIVVTIPTMLYSLSQLIHLMQTFGWSLGFIRNSYYSGDVTIGQSGFDYIATISATFSIPAMFLFFYYYTQNKKAFAVFMLVLSMNMIVQDLRAASRNAIFMWLMALTFNYYYFKPLLQNKGLVQDVSKIFRRIAMCVCSVFMLITMSRSALQTGENSSPLYFLLDYFGQSFIYFSYKFDTFFDGAFGGQRVFSFLFDTGISGQLNEILDADFYLNTFSTFIGDFYLDLGYWGTIISAICFCLIFNVYFRCSRYITFSKYVIFMFVLIGYSIGLFYWIYSAAYWPKGLIMYLILCFPLSKVIVSKIR